VQFLALIDFTIGDISSLSLSVSAMSLSSLNKP